MSSDNVAARTATFDLGAGWCHEGKRGWKCKTTRLVEAGWCYDPAPDVEDGTTCFYCSLSLDGWEPKDDPYEEHRRRSPECPFFVLCEQYHGPGKPKARTAKAKAKGKARGSTASQASRLSTQSAFSVAMSEAPSLDVPMSEREDDTVMSNATITSQAVVKGAKKKAGKAAKGGKGKKTIEPLKEPEYVEPEPEPSRTRQSQAPGAFPDSSLLEPEDPTPRPAKPTRKGTRQSKQLDPSVIEVSQIDPAPKEAARGRKAKAQPEPEPEPEPEEVSAQLQLELEHSMGDDEMPDHESSLQALPVSKPKRGTKRTSDGIKKEQNSSIIMGMEFPAPPAPAMKSKRGRKPSKQVTASQEPAVEPIVQGEEALAVEQPELEEPAPEPQLEIEKPTKKTTAKSKKAPAKKGKGRKASSTRSSKATVTASEPEPEIDVDEDLARDEAEIEAELERIAAEEAARARAAAVAAEQEKTEEYESTPSQHGRFVDKVDDAQLPAEPPTAHSPKPEAEESGSRPAVTPSPTGSDKENNPSSSFQPAPATASKAPALSATPALTTRIPLGPGTPNRLLSPSKRAFLSPTKQPLSKLTSTIPWSAIDLDTVLLASPQATTPGGLSNRLMEMTGALTSPEKKMSVEEWVRWRAERGEEELRRKCEELVGVFEREGVRALSVLGGVEAI